MKIFRRFAYLILTVSALIFCAFAAAESDEWSPPQQSKTGPIPSDDIRMKGPDPHPLSPTDGLILNVPAYLWRHGCGPTAVGMVIGYYDTHGFNLIPGDATTQTAAVDQAIASEDSPGNPQHYEDYSEPMDTGQSSPLPDRSELPDGDEHISNCVADFMETSFSSRGNFYGWSWSSDIGNAFMEYVISTNPSYAPSYAMYVSTNLTWNVLTTEIDANRPMVFLVDTDGNGGTDHFVTVIGYRDSLGYPEYACLDTWSSTIRWEPFEYMAAGTPWGIWGGWCFGLTVSGPDVPSTSVWGLVLILSLFGRLLLHQKEIV